MEGKKGVEGKGQSLVSQLQEGVCCRTSGGALRHERDSLVAERGSVAVGMTFVGSGDCEEFDLTIADGPEEPDPVVFTDVASTVVDRHSSPSTSLLDALDRFSKGGRSWCCRCGWRGVGF